ncbi:MAG: branched-chain amino acid ABC transporter permease [Candidatus Competibacterales bacterium]
MGELKNPPWGRWLGLLVVLVALVGLALLPRFGGYFTVILTTEILIMALFATSYNLVFGYTGMLSFGHAAFFGMGTYTTAAILRDFSVDFIWLLPASMATAGLLALAIGALSVRRDEVYFAMLTLAFGMLIHAVAYQWRSFTNGSDGITGFPLGGLAPGVNINLANPMVYYYVVLGVVVVALGVLYRITRSPLGLVLVALRENPERVAFTGLSIYRYRLVAFGISGAFSGLAGALFAPFSRVASPEHLHWSTAAEPVLMTVLGGSQVFLGPLVGSAAFLLLKDWITATTDQWMLVLGIVLGIVVIVFPGGLLGTLQQGLAWLGVRIQGRSTPGVDPKKAVKAP